MGGGIAETDEAGVNRLTNRTAPGGYRIGFTYTDWGARQSMVDASGTTTYTYDDMRRLITNATPQGTLFYAYDPSGSVTNISSSTVRGVRLGYGYDLLGRLTNVLERSVRAAHYSFDKVGNLARAHLSLFASDVVTNRLDYDALNRLTNSVWGWDWDPAPLANFHYKLGPTGSRTNLVETFYTSSYGANRTYNWQYDRLYRLTNEVVTGTASSNCSYSFDSVGNRLSWTNTPQTFATYGYDSNNRMTNCGIVSFVYDENGNTRTNGADVYRYDAENRLTNAVVGGTAVSYVYNGDGIRVRKTLGSTTTLYLVDDKNPTGYAQVLEERTVTGGFTNAPTVYCWGLSIILQRHEAGFYYYCQDGHGNVRFMTDEFGEASDAFAYDAYGTVIDESHQSLSHAKCTHLYTGEEWDPDLGMYYLRARWYRPEIGRFWTMDTFGGNNEDPLSLHNYLYCQGNPVTMTDPSGLYSTYRQYYGYAVEDAIQDFYEEDNPGPLPPLKSKRVYRKDSPLRWLFPDIYDPNTSKWLEVKPLSVKGVLSGEAKRTLNMKALPGSPDLFWQSPLLIQIATGETFVTVNVAGVVYYQREDLVEKELITLIASGVAYGAKDLLRYVSARAAGAAIQGSVRPVLVCCTVIAAGGKAIDSARFGAHLGIAFLLAAVGVM